MGKKVGILGSGAVAKALAAGFKKYGYEVMVGSRDAKKQEIISQTIGVQTGTFEQAAAFGDLAVLAVKGHAAKQVMELAGPGNLRGKTVLDTTNPIAEGKIINGVLHYFTGPNESLMEDLQKTFVDVNFVKCFNSVGNAMMVNPDFGDEKPTMFICGNSEAAKAETKTILDLFGYETEDCGAVEAARAIEPLCMLWCIRGFKENKWSQAFRYLKK
jgi:predicted dinucleotide-binding enzyme